MRMILLHPLSFSFCDILGCRADFFVILIRLLAMLLGLSAIRSKFSKSTNQTQKGEATMNHSVWNQLPDHMLESILVHLPTQSLLRLRCVCRRWKKLIDSAAFSCSHSRHHSRQWLLMFKLQDRSCCAVYDGVEDRWGTLSFSFLPKHNALEVVAVCRGLICFKVATSGALLICNPLTKMWKFLHPLETYQRRAPVSMVLDPHTSSLKILIPGSGSGGCNTVLYDSATNCWKRTSNPPHRTEFRSDAPYCNGVFYFAAIDPVHVLTYNIEEDAWMTIAVPQREHLTYACVVGNHRHVFLITGSGIHGIIKNLSLWQLQTETMEWTLLHQMPESMCRRLLSLCFHTYKQIRCISYEDYICLFCSNSSDVLVYKISRRTWHWLPECPSLSGTKSCGFSWFSIEPSLQPLP